MAGNSKALRHDVEWDEWQNLLKERIDERLVEGVGNGEGQHGFQSRLAALVSALTAATSYYLALVLVGAGNEDLPPSMLARTLDETPWTRNGELVTRLRYRESGLDQSQK